MTQTRKPATKNKTGAMAQQGPFWPERFDGVVLAGASLLLLVLRLAYLRWWTPYGLGPDEAQYWHWLSHLDWSYLTKPPLTTWLMGVSTAVIGKSLIGVKAFALLAQLAVAYLGYLLAREAAPAAQKRAAGWWAFGLLTTVPLVAAGGLIMSPDAVMLPLWMAALWTVAKGLGDEPRGLCWGRWVSVGILIGFSGLGKYSAAFFFPLLGVFLLLERPRWLLRPQIWVSGLIALVFQLPVLIWNMQHDGVGLAHVVWQATAAEEEEHFGRLESLVEFWGSQAGLLQPLVFAGLLAAWGWGMGWWGKRSVFERYLTVMTVPIFVGFSALSLSSKVEGNWPLLGMIPGLVLVAVWLVQQKGRWLVWVAAGCLVVNALLSIGLYDTRLVREVGIHLKMKNDPTKDLRGWQDMGMLLGTLLNSLDNPIILSTRYQTAAQVAFHTGGGREVIYLNAEGRRMNEYDLWAWPNLERRLVVYVNENSSLPDGVNELFEHCAPWHKLAVEQEKTVVRRLNTWVCWGAR